MRRVAWFAIFLATVFVGAAVLAPPLWHVAQAIIRGSEADWARWLSRQPFHRYVQRLMLVLAVAGLWPLARAMGLRTVADLGFREAHRAARLWIVGFAAGAAMFGVSLGIECALGLRMWRADGGIGRWAGVLVTAGLAGWLVGWLEETVYRGVLFGGLRRGLGWGPAAVGSSVVYAWVHFLGRPAAVPEVTWDAGWVVLREMLAESVDGHRLLPGLPTLFVAGLLLAGIYRRTGSLFCSIGLHGGWVFWIKLRGSLSAATPGGQELFPESRISAGWTGFIAVTVAALLFFGWESSSRRQNSSTKLVGRLTGWKRDQDPD